MPLLYLKGWGPLPPFQHSLLLWGGVFWGKSFHPCPPHSGIPDFIIKGLCRGYAPKSSQFICMDMYDVKPSLRGILAVVFMGDMNQSNGPTCEPLTSRQSSLHLPTFAWRPPPLPGNLYRQEDILRMGAEGQKIIVKMQGQVQFGKIKSRSSFSILRTFLGHKTFSGLKTFRTAVFKVWGGSFSHTSLEWLVGIPSCVHKVTEYMHSFVLRGFSF